MSFYVSLMVITGQKPTVDTKDKEEGTSAYHYGKSPNLKERGQKEKGTEEFQNS